MPRWLFPDSLTNRETYAKAQEYWASLWQRIGRSNGAGTEWRTPWMNNPLPDGNPIFTAISADGRRGVRVIQEDPGDPDDLLLDWWLGSFGEEAVPELVIACCPSTETREEIERLLREWVQTGRIDTPAPVGKPGGQDLEAESERSA